MTRTIPEPDHHTWVQSHSDMGHNNTSAKDTGKFPMTSLYLFERHQRRVWPYLIWLLAYGCTLFFDLLDGKFGFRLILPLLLPILIVLLQVIYPTMIGWIIITIPTCIYWAYGVVLFIHCDLNNGWKSDPHGFEGAVCFTLLETVTCAALLLGCPKKRKSIIT